MKIYCYKKGRALYPADDDQWTKLSKLKEMDIVEVDVKKPRNIQFHRKYFALLNVVFEQQDKYINREHFRHEIQIRAGHFESFITEKGETVYIPKSISFASMDEHSFSKLYDNVVSICLVNFLPAGYSADDINFMVESRLRFA